MRATRNLFVVLAVSAVIAGQESSEILGQQAVAAERRGDFPQAITLFKELIGRGLDSPELQSNLGIAYYQSGDLQNALKSFGAVLKTAPNAPAANLFCGLSLAKLQRAKDALPYLARANAAEPDNPATLAALAQAEVAAGQITSANQHFRQITAVDSRNAEAWYSRGITDRLLAEAKSKQAKQASNFAQAQRESRSASDFMNDFQKSTAIAMQLDPGSVRADMILGESFRIAERYEEAIREYKAATERAPNLPAAWAGLAAAYSAAGDDERALASVKHAEDLDPNDPETDTLLAAIYVRMGDLEKAEPFIRRALAERPDISSAHVVLAKLYLARKQPARALPELEAAAKDDTDGSTNYLLATTLRRLGRNAEAAAAMRNFERLHRTPVSSGQ